MALTPEQRLEVLLDWHAQDPSIATFLDKDSGDQVIEAVDFGLTEAFTDGIVSSLMAALPEFAAASSPAQQERLVFGILAKRLEVDPGGPV